MLIVKSKDKERKGCMPIRKLLERWMWNSFSKEREKCTIFYLSWISIFCHLLDQLQSRNSSQVNMFIFRIFLKIWLKMRCLFWKISSLVLFNRKDIFFYCLMIEKDLCRKVFTKIFWWYCSLRTRSKRKFGFIGKEELLAPLGLNLSE